MDRDLYEILGIEQGASVEDIRDSYRKLSKMFHPDAVSGSDEEKAQAQKVFGEISKAAQILLNPTKKENYDKWGHDGPPDMSDTGLLDQEGEVFGIDIEEFVRK